MTLQVFFAAALTNLSDSILQLCNELRHPRVVLAVQLAVLVDVGGQDVHEAHPRYSRNR
jgi:hypothetical protein